MAVSKNAIRVQLPGGAPYAPAFSEAASKIGARSGLSKRKASALTKMVDASVALLNSGAASTITLEMRIHDDSFSAKLIGKRCQSPTKTSVTKLEALAEKRTTSFEYVVGKSQHAISFVI